MVGAAAALESFNGAFWLLAELADVRVEPRHVKRADKQPECL